MKLIMHTSIFSLVFAGFLASALTTKTTAPVRPQHRLPELMRSGVPKGLPGSTQTMHY
jgi:hypothetical protein